MPPLACGFERGRNRQLFDLDRGGPDHFSPLCDLVAPKRSELIGRAADQVETERGSALRDIGLAQRIHDLLIEAGNDRGGRAGALG